MKQNELIDVLTDDGTIGLARVVEGKGCYVTVQFLNRIRKNTYAFDYDIEVIPREAIQGFYDTDDMSITGMYRTIRDNVYERYEEPESESDGDFSYEDYTTADDESVSLVDSDANDTEDEE
jgi:hypothetical protein